MTNLFASFTKSQGEAKANFLALSGLNLAFRTIAEPASKELIVELFKTNIIADILFGNCSLYATQYRGDLLSTSFTYARDNKIDLSVRSGFKEWITANSSRLNDDIATSRYKNYWETPSTESAAIIEAGFISGLSDPEKLFNLKFKTYPAYYRLSNFDLQLMKSIAARTPKVIIDQIEDIGFASAVGYDLRSAIYGVIAETGHLTKKAARKIRSDASEQAATIGIRTIAANIHKFPNANEVLAQVMDTKYFAPAKFLAETIPRDLLPFMAVCENHEVRKIVVNRMQNDED